MQGQWAWPRGGKKGWTKLRRPTNPVRSVSSRTAETILARNLEECAKKLRNALHLASINKSPQELPGSPLLDVARN